MKKVTLKSITMHNFRGEKERTTMFNQSGETFICGRNGLGKSRHFDATIWLLFGKDSADRKDYEIKTKINGEELHEVETYVVGVFDVDGQEITLKRAIIEDWVKPRGTTERVFKGNRTECAWNNTPVSVTEYTRRVSEIIDATIFKIVTNPAYFVGMKWQDQREQLMTMAGNITDDAIIANHPEFAALIDRISGKSLADYRKELNATRRKLKQELDDIQPRIDQTQRMMPDVDDVEQVEQAIADCDARIADIDRQIADASAAVRKSYEQAQERERHIGELKLKQQQLVIDTQAQANADAANANITRRQYESELKTLCSERASLNIQSGRIASEITAKKKEIDRDMERRESLLNDWHAIQAEKYAGETTCPHCGQELPQEMRDRAMMMFNDNKVSRMNAITEQGKAINARVESLKKEIAALQEQAGELSNRGRDLDAEIESKQQWVVANPAIQAAQVNGNDIPEWNAIQQEIITLRDEVVTDNTGLDTTALQVAKSDEMAKRDELRNRIAKQEQRKQAEQEIARLEEHGKDLAQQVADIEQLEFTAESFVRARVAECERRINGMFTMVQFKMFDYTQDGNAFETCIPMVNGVPYGVANTAAQINAGIDIINTMVKFYGVSAPVYIDNAESVNQHIPCESQVINLVVTTDDELTIK